MTYFLGYWFFNRHPFIRFRTQPGCGGQTCSGALTETKACSGTNASDCVWNSWGNWNQCSESICGAQGNTTRTRTIR